MIWNNFYKWDEGYDGAPTNVLYEPFVSQDQTLFRMDFNNSNKYFYNENYTEDMVNFYFERETKYLKEFSGSNFTPEVVDIDYTKRSIIYKWYNKNLNRGLFGNDFVVEDLQPNWQEQVKIIIEKFKKQDVFKLNLYPHTFYLDADNNLRVSDMYACINLSNHFIEAEKIKPVLDPSGGISNERFEMFTKDNKTNLLEVYNYSMKINYGQWPGDFLNA